MIKNFLEDEAELSGDDVGSDEDDDNEGDKKEGTSSDVIKIYYCKLGHSWCIPLKRGFPQTFSIATPFNLFKNFRDSFNLNMINSVKYMFVAGITLCNPWSSLRDPEMGRHPQFRML